ncbi:MAG: hypothetical protein RSC43_03190, partial [Clostridia bacterium]
IKVPKIVVDPTAKPPETREELYSYYNQIKRGMKKEQVEALFGKGTVKQSDDGENMFTLYINEEKSAGVNIIYSFDDIVRTKLLYYNKAGDLTKFSNPFDEKKISEIEEKDQVAKANEVLGGAGLEIAYEFSQNSPTDYSKIIVWYNKNGSSFQLNTNNETITKVIFNVDPSRR